jgi:glycosyltransferase involved in cell wall biosynthesis
MLVESAVLRRVFQVRAINTTLRQRNSEKGQIDLALFAGYLRYLSRLLQALLFFRPDFVLYCPTSATLLGWTRDGTTLFLSSLLGARVATQFRGGHFRYFFDALGAVPRRIIGGLLRRSSLVLVQADRLKPMFSGIVAENRLARLYNAIPLGFFARFEGLSRPQSPAEITVLFVGHLTKAKGYCDLLRTIPGLAAQHRIRFRFIGAAVPVERNVFINQATGEPIAPEDPAKCYREQIESRGLQGRVEFLGDQVHGEDKLRAFAEADIFVQPSYSEGFSRSILEALAAGLPAVVTNVGAAPEILEDGVNAFVIGAGDEAALADRLDRLARDPGLRRAMGAAGRECCRRQFLPDAVAGQLVTLLESMPAGSA